MNLSVLRVAAVQAESRAGDVRHNVAIAARWVAKAAAEDAPLVVLPELFLPGYDPKTLREDPDGCDVTVDDPRLGPLSEAAASAGVTLVVGASVREGERRLLSALVFSTTGDIAATYAKQHLWDAERGIFTPGTHGTSLVFRGWDLGLGICYDGCFPEHARAATDAGALVYVCPSAYVVGSEHRRDVYYAARAIDNGIYVVFAGLVGPCGELEFSGGTAVYDPQGRTLSRVESGEGMVVVDLDPEAIAEARRINPYERDRVSDTEPRHILPL
ncbi:MAG TPA: carbon-nitrogen hydrolase family protein [Nocardioidaceae bacterium]|jgi:predicted amidohydrolase